MLLPLFLDIAAVASPTQAWMGDAGSSRDSTPGSRKPTVKPMSHQPPPGAAGDEAALDKLVQRALATDKSGRGAFAASLWKRAAAAATALHGGASLAAAKCTLEQAASTYGQARAEASCIDKAALRAEAWALASSVLPLLSTRMDNNTLLPGRCTTEEVEFFKCFTLAKHAASDPPLPARDLQLIGFGVGYAMAMNISVLVLCQIVRDQGPPPAALALVLRAVDMVRSARTRLLYELLSDAFVCRCCQPRAACERSC